MTTRNPPVRPPCDNRDKWATSWLRARWRSGWGRPRGQSSGGSSVACSPPDALAGVGVSRLTRLTRHLPIRAPNRRLSDACSSRTEERSPVASRARAFSSGSTRSCPRPTVRTTSTFSTPTRSWPRLAPVAPTRSIRASGSLPRTRISPSESRRRISSGSDHRPPRSGPWATRPPPDGWRPRSTSRSSRATTAPTRPTPRLPVRPARSATRSSSSRRRAAAAKACARSGTRPRSAMPSPRHVARRRRRSATTASSSSGSSRERGTSRSRSCSMPPATASTSASATARSSGATRRSSRRVRHRRSTRSSDDGSVTQPWPSGARSATSMPAPASSSSTRAASRPSSR